MKSIVAILMIVFISKGNAQVARSFSLSEAKEYALKNHTKITPFFVHIDYLFVSTPPST